MKKKHLIVYGYDYGTFPEDVALGIASSKAHYTGGEVTVSSKSVVVE